MNSTYTVHNSIFCPPKSTYAKKKKKQKTNKQTNKENTTPKYGRRIPRNPNALYDSL